MDEAMFWDYSLWLSVNGYIEDCDEARYEYELWKIEQGAL